MTPIRVLIADDHVMVQESFKMVLDREPDIQVIGEARDGREAIRLSRSLKPDVVLMDISMPLLTGLDAIHLVREAMPHVKVVVVTMFHKEPYIRQAFEQGALGYVLKTAPVSELVAAIRKAAKGEYFLSAQIKHTIINAYITNKETGKGAPTHFDRLTDREKQVFRMIVKGLSIKSIADLLHISPKTVAKHRSNLMEKLELQDNLALVRYALKNGIFTPEDLTI
jgi:DNA-binding NarL/FixJ family response regulator